MNNPKILIFCLICQFSSNNADFKVKKLGDTFTIEDLVELKPEWNILLPKAEKVLVRNGTILSRYKRNYTIECGLKENCHRLVIKNFTKELVGAYSKGNGNWTEIAGYEAPLSFNCNSISNNKCEYNSSTKTLTVQEDKPVNIQCSAILWNNVNNEEKLKLGIKGFESNTEPVLNIVPEDGLLKIELTSLYSKKKFSRKSDKKLTCEFSYYEKNILIERTDVNLVVEYGPEYELEGYESAQTVRLGINSKLTCPINGYPLVYYWKKLGDNSKEFMGEKEYILPNNYTIGEYRFQCRVEMSNIWFAPVYFEVKVTEKADYLTYDAKQKLSNTSEPNDYQITLIKNIGDHFILRSPSKENQNYSEIEWLYINENGEEIEIYKNGNFAENFKNGVKCVNEPIESICEALEIENFNKNMIGEYLKRYKSEGNDYVYRFILTSYLKELSISCEKLNNNTCCNINEKSKKLFVKEDRSVDLECSISVLSAIDIDSDNLELHMTDCEDKEDIITSNDHGNGLIEYTFKTNCKRSFYKTDKSFICSILDYDHSSYFKSKVLDLVVEYGPIEDSFDENYFNKTINYGESIVLKCPIDGYPIKYSWKDDKHHEYPFGKYFTLPRHLEARLHKYECKAVIGNAIESKSYKFEINKLG